MKTRYYGNPLLGVWIDPSSNSSYTVRELKENQDKFIWKPSVFENILWPYTPTDHGIEALVYDEAE